MMIFVLPVPSAVQITAGRFIGPGWQLTALLNGRRATLNRCCSVIHKFALDIINKRRQQLAAAAAAAGAGGAAGSGAARNADEAAAGADADGDGDGLAARDLLSLFMGAQGPGGKPLNDKQLIDIVINFIIAGRDTTAQVGLHIHEKPFQHDWDVQLWQGMKTARHPLPLLNVS
jgi:hypothetical protein